MVAIWILSLTVACGPVSTFAPEGDTDVDADTDADTDTDTDTDTDVPNDYEHTFLLDIAEGTIVEPPAIGPLIAPAIDVYVLLGTSEPDASALGMIAAVSDDSMPPQQDMCNPTVVFPPINYSSKPSFNAQADVLAFSLNGYDVNLDDLAISGTFATPDYDSIEDMTVTAAIDTRPLVPMIDPYGEDDANCEFLAALQIPCIDCKDGSGQFCLNFQVTELEAAEVPGPIIVKVDEKDIANNPNCVY